MQPKHEQTSYGESRYSQYVTITYIVIVNDVIIRWLKNWIRFKDLALETLHSNDSIDVENSLMS